MKALVTGAAGFLGRHVVARLLERGHAVRALVRAPRSHHEGDGCPAWGAGVELVHGDLRTHPHLEDVLAGVDVVVHLAAAVGVDEDTMFASTVVGTERLVDAMVRANVRRMVFASSLVVYDWHRARGTLDEGSPLADDPYARGPYDLTKVWQERVVTRAARAHGWSLTVLRPGFVWGRGREAIAGMGRVMGPVHVVIGPAARLPLTHVENCADCFVTAAERHPAGTEIYDVVDGDEVRAWRYARAYARGMLRPPLLVPLPYQLARATAALATATSRALFGARGKLPSLLALPRFEAQFKPLRYGHARLRDGLGWTPPLSFEECLRRTYGAAPG